MPNTLKDIVERMQAAGETEDNIATVIQNYKEPAAAPQVRSRTGQIYTPPAEGGGREFVGGALNAVKEAVDPRTYVRALKSAYDDPGGAVLNAVKAPFRLAGSLATNPAETLGGLTTGVAMGAALPPGAKGLARTGGEVMEQVGTKGSWPLRISGAHMMGSGNVIPGAAMTLVPEALKTAGRKLKQWGGAVVENPDKLPSGARELNFGDIQSPNIGVQPPTSLPVQRGVPQVGMPAEASGRVQKIVAQEQAAAAAATANADKLTAIKEARQGMEPGKPAFRESLSAKTPEGGSASMSRSFSAPEESDPMASLTPEQRARVVGPGTPGRTAVSMSSGQNVKQPIRITGKAAKDLAEGRTPIASKAPMPSDVRMDELVQKLGGRRAGEAPGLAAPREDLWDAGRRSQTLGEAGSGQFRSGAGLPGSMTPTEMLPGAGSPDPKIPLSRIPASESSRAMSALPNLSAEDYALLQRMTGAQPEMIKGLSLSAFERFLNERAQRSARYRGTAAGPVIPEN